MPWLPRLNRPAAPAQSTVCTGVPARTGVDAGARHPDAPRMTPLHGSVLPLNLPSCGPRGSLLDSA